MNTILTKSKWKAHELDQQRIQFRIPLEDGSHEGLGVLWAMECPNDFLSISIVCDLPQAQHSGTQIRIPIPQPGTDAIKLHPNQTVARFRLYQ